MRFLSAVILTLICSVFAAPALASGGQTNIGFLSLTTSGEYAVPVAVWYPTAEPQVEWQAGPYTIHATRGAAIAAGPHPLIILSHGSGGSEFGHSDLAEALAGHGYIVAAPRHLGDSYDQPEGRFSDVQIIGRPWQAAATLDAVLADQRIGAAIDARRIGMAGFSAGAYTTMVMAGAKPDPALYSAYCAAHADDHEVCPDGDHAKLRITRPGWSVPTDKRVRAAVAMAPFSVMFDAKSVSDVTIPLRIYKASDDQVLRNQWNTDHLLSLLPASVEHGELAGGHYVFIAPCSAVMKARTPYLCVDAPGVDRVAEHAQLNAEIVDFFNRKLPKPD
ncbi:alpha/beta hydrolase family protein [Collimonas fungivorans]|uniref:Putative lipoprotein signal peptide n=1 Tax=Collimonas fungivorans (strain Ter331) TaxID=1005048 RepID=G0A9N2_COLFT|nr:lipoprotein signal peptide [Collimonas fungivorans]AEK62655.1 putative lipoprotein signal peptide [Collimonas fungivorans Ter331]